MKNISKFFLIPLFLSPAFSQEEKVVAKVNGEAVLLSDFNKNKEILSEQYAALSPDFLNQKDSSEKMDKMVMDKLVNETLLRQKAEAMKIKVYERQIDDGVTEIKKRFQAETPAQADAMFLEELKRQNLSMAQFREKIKRDLMARKLIEEVVKPKVRTPEEKDIRAYFDRVNAIIEGKSKDPAMKQEEYDEYSNIAAKFKEIISERLRVRHILIKPETDSLPDRTKALNEASRIKKELDGGADFEDMAAKFSKDKQSALRGGDIGYVIRGMLPEELEKAVFKMCPGEISGPIESKFGYHIVRLDEKRIAQKLKYEMAKDDIAQIIMQNSFADEIEKYTENLKKEAKIEYFNK
ncbi:MAG: peptidylprolyl isomerase [Elusimicrobiota bacterium]